MRLTVILAICLCFSVSGVNAGNTVRKLSDSVMSSPNEQELFFTFNGFSTSRGMTTIYFNILASNIPFSIKGIHFINRNSIVKPLKPLTMTVTAEEAKGKRLEWDVAIEMPALTHYDTTDRLVIETDLGCFEILSAREAIILRESKMEYSRMKTIVIAVSAIGLILIAAIFLIYRRRLSIRESDMRRMTAIMKENQEQSSLLQTHVSELYSKQMETVNMLCDEYFGRSTSDKVRLTLYNEVERQILSMRNPQSVKGLTELVNKYLDNILVRVTSQLPSLSKKDILFLTYIYAGFSPRAICIFCDIKIKNFYNRRSRIKDKILTSEAPDREEFVSKM